MVVGQMKRLMFPMRKVFLTGTDWLTVLLTVLIGVIATSPTEWIALAWRTWTYNPERTFYTTFLGAEVETFLFTALVAFVVSTATLRSARREDRKRSQVS